MSCGCRGGGGGAGSGGNDNLSSAARCAATGATVTRVLSCDGRFTTLLRLLKQTGLDKLVDSAESITLFAATDAAFDKLSKETMCCLCAHPKRLREVLETSMLDGARILSQLAMAPPQTWTTLAGVDITVDFRSNPSRAVVIDPLGRCAAIVDPNVTACNARIQVVNNVLFPRAMCGVTEAVEGSCQCIPRSLGAPVDAAQAAQNAALAAAQTGAGCACRN